jgi:hypothetical protein
MIQGQIQGVQSYIAGLKPLSDAMKGEVIFIKFRLLLNQNDSRKLEYGLRLLARVAPELTPYARMLLSDWYINNEGSKPESLKRAVQLWPDNLEAHGKLKEYYESIKQSGLAGAEDEKIKAINQKMQRNIDLAPRRMFMSLKEELVSHLVKAPVMERLVYSGVPMLISILVAWLSGVMPAVGLLGIVSLNLDMIQTLALFPMWALSVTFFVAKHEEGRTAAWIVALSSALPVFLSDLTPVFYMGTVIGLHFLVNTAVFFLNSRMESQIASYATIEVPLPEQVAVQPEYRGIIGISNVSPGDIASIAREKSLPDNILIVPAADKAGLEQVAEQNNISADMPFIYIEMEKDSTAEDIFTIIEDAVNMAQIRRLTDRYPVLLNTVISGGRSAERILAATDRDEMISILEEIDMTESPEDVLGSLVNDLYRTGIQPEEKLIPSAENSEVWVREYLDKLREYKNALKEGRPVKGLEGGIMKYQEGLNAYMSGLPPDELKSMILRHTDISISSNLEVNAKRLFDFTRDRGIVPKDVPRAIVIDGRAETGFDMKQMLPGLSNLAETEGLEVAVITDEAADKTVIENIRGAGIIPIEGLVAGTPDEIINRIREDIPGVPAEFIAIATGEFMREAILTHIEATKSDTQNTANFVIAGKTIMAAGDESTDKVNSLIPGLTAMNLIRRSIEDSDESSIVAVAVDDTTLNALTRILRSLVNITRMDINAAIRSFIDSMLAVASSV